MDDITTQKQAAVAELTAGSDDAKPSVGRIDNVPYGIVMMIAATILFAAASAASKWLVGIYPVGEVLFLRSFSSLLSCAALILPVTGLSVIATRRPRDHLFRGLSQSVSQLCLVLAFSLMPLAGAVAINFSSPLFAALVSIVWLKESAGWVRGGALIVGFFGVLIVTDPGANSLTLGALFALINAILYGTVTVAVRGMTRTESANTLVIWQLMVLTVMHSLLLFFGWRSPTPLDWALMFGSGFVNMLGQWCWTKALHMAPAPAVTPFYYLMLVWALMFGFLIWGEVPGISLLIGSAIVVATGLFLFLREARLQQTIARRAA
ncbi:MAG TPA: DMT family transporter [Xanthobacteraceae bacterium]|jgi:drug/metabolite transporter (DMT)-like permease|nr:DMT family transporter [Xanthobacteraceae bacterium]